MKKLILTVAVLILILGMSMPAFADIYNERGERLGATMEEVNAHADKEENDFHIAHGDEKRADGNWHSKLEPTDAEMERMKTDWDSKMAAAEAARVAFIAKGDFSPAAAQVFANQEAIKTMGTGIVVPKTATMPDGSPVGLSIDTPKPKTPAVVKADEPKKEAPKYEAPKVLVSVEK